jgi:hypothetical protein
MGGDGLTVFFTVGEAARTLDMAAPPLWRWFHMGRLRPVAQLSAGHPLFDEATLNEFRMTVLTRPKRGGRPKGSKNKPKPVSAEA